LANLFKGYKAATDDVFVKYIEKKEEDYDGGHGIQPMRLMELMERNKYKPWVEENKWKAPSEDDSTKIIATTRCTGSTVLLILKIGRQK
jgi:hypothetical protein